MSKCVEKAAGTLLPLSSHVTQACTKINVVVVNVDGI